MSMSGYTKLFSSILASTIWREDDITRIVWITLLAMADKNGVAEGSVPGLADFARVSVDACRAALRKLEAPDEDSRSKEHGGARIKPLEDGSGWQLLNHAKYRRKMSQDERREYLRIKQAEHRSRQHESTNVNNGQQLSTGVSDKYTLSTQAEAEAKADTEAVAEIVPISIKVPRTTIDAEFSEFWRAYPWKRGKGSAQKAWLKAGPPPLASVIDALKWQRNQPQWLKDGGQFIPLPATWLNQRRWEDEPFQGPNLSPQSVRALQQAQKGATHGVF